MGQVGVGIGAFGIETGPADLLIVEGIRDLRQTVNAPQRTVHTGVGDVKRQCPVRHGLRQ